MTTITKIEVILLKIPYVHPFRIALAVMDSAQSIIIRIHDDSGLTGVGEGCPPRFVTGETPETAYEAARQLARLLIGRNPLEIDSIENELQHYLSSNSAVRCAFDLALYDLLAKHANLPLYALLGGKKQSIRSNRTIGMDTPAAMAKTAESFIKAGAIYLKVKVGTKVDDLARVKEIRKSAGPDILLRLDANQGWDEPTAVRLLNEMAPYNIQVCEQPLPAWNETGLKRLRERSQIPIMADESIFSEHDAFRLASNGSVDYINIKLAKSAGIHTALKINAVSAAAGISCMLGGMAETMIGVSAAAHLICACPNIVLADLDSPFHFVDNPIQGGVDFHPDGTVTLLDTVGHGADLKPEWYDLCQKEIVY